ncbi:MAG: hypothetical protein WC120_00570 [Parcubacteria group bacterium]
MHVSEYIRGTMLDILARIMGDMNYQLQNLNRVVEKKDGRKLNLRLLDVHQAAEDDWRIRIKGDSSAGRESEEEFQIVWWPDTCPENFHLLQLEWTAFGSGRDFVYRGVMAQSAESIARELAIYTHGEQIPGILSRI